MSSQTARPPEHVRLLDVEPELAARLRPDDRIEAADRLRLPVTVVPEGRWMLDGIQGTGAPFAVMVIDGMLLYEVHLGGRSALHLLGPGDVVVPQGDSGDALAAALRITAAFESRVVVLDDRLQGPFSLWPGLAVGLAERAAQQLTRQAVRTAIAQLPRVEDRIEATFWDLAERWGKVTPLGIHVPLQLTHEVLGLLVGGRRSTVTLALSELAERGILLRRPDRSWMLVADAPSLPRSEEEADTLPVVATVVDVHVQRHAERRTPPPPPPPPSIIIHEELMRATVGMRAEHEAQTARVADHLRHCAEVRDHCREVRERLERDRGLRTGVRITPRTRS